MTNRTYDIITVGSGMGGSSLARAMAGHGARVLALERERKFKDRVRGEFMAPWGVAEAKELGVYELLRDRGGHDLPFVDMYAGPLQFKHRDLRATTPQGAPALAIYHPAMQEALLQGAAEAGVEVRPAAVGRDVKPGKLPTVVIEHEGRVEEVKARLIVGVDGRGSMVRRWTEFPVRRDSERLRISGVMLENMFLPPDDTNFVVFNLPLGRQALLFPQGQGRVRAYFVCRKDANLRLQGARDVGLFMEESVRAGAPAEWFEGARAAGPLATFDGADTWVDHPYKEGVVLIGDAAAASDPTWGQGLSLTLRDVRVLRDKLLSHEDWDTAGHAYAEEHDRYYGRTHTLDNWWAEMFFGTSPEAEARRAKALPLIAQDVTRLPDHIFIGPDVPVDQTVRRRFFGEEQTDTY